MSEGFLLTCEFELAKVRLSLPSKKKKGEVIIKHLCTFWRRSYFSFDFVDLIISILIKIPIWILAFHVMVFEQAV